MLDFHFKTEPLPFQGEIFTTSREVPDWGLLMDMGTGKTKLTIDTAAWMYAAGEIDFMLVVAPNDVHVNWIEEMEKHMPEFTRYVAAPWQSYMRKAEEAKARSVLDPATKCGLRVLTMNVDAFGVPLKSYNKKAGKIARWILTHYRCLFVVDECNDIKNPSAARTRRLDTLGGLAAHHRILTGTLIANSPLDSYGPFHFMGPQHLGFDNFTEFKHHYARWENVQIRGKVDKKGRPLEFEEVVEWLNLDELTEKIHKVSSRVRKKDVLKDLPPKIYRRIPTKMAPEQERLYKKVVEESLIEVQGEDFAIQHILTNWIRRQQILGGFLPNPLEQGATVPIFDNPMKNPRVRDTMNVIEESGDQKAIIWCRFTAEIQMWLKILGERAVGYYGLVDKDSRLDARKRFQEDDTCQWFVGSTAAGGRGLTLHAATVTLYYSNTFSLVQRLQSEDRPHRIGQKNAVLYGDLECVGTIDSKIIRSCIEKFQLAALIQRDDPTTWL